MVPKPEDFNLRYFSHKIVTFHHIQAITWNFQIGRKANIAIAIKIYVDNNKLLTFLLYMD